MPSYRDYYFSLKNNDKYHFTDTIIYALFSYVSNMDKTQVILHFDNEIDSLVELDDLVGRIINGEPYQYVLGYAYFLGNKFYVNKDVLIPRQETEQLVTDSLELIKKKYNRKIDILDMCSGSGCIGISLAKNIDANVDMVDISIKANEIAKKNNELNKTNCRIIESDMFTSLTKKTYDVIISNPPYIKDSSTVDKATMMNEPHLALFASPQTRFYEEIMVNCSEFLAKDGLLAFEIDEDMEEDLVIIIKKHLPNSTYYFKKDMYNKTRFLYIEG
ncbi:MAG: peptide chain release factor N(5)-glutamine methyltransferase [Bacilli bacterium]|nr:peptide chain release factor N(5)-glutamine methyltransferase [Bacilli bacterium]